MSLPTPLSPYASRITGTGSAFPRTSVTNDELALSIETSDEWIRERTGIRSRRISKAGDPSEFNSALGFEAAKKALEMAGKRPEDIDQILYATSSPDTPLPATACRLQAMLGARNAWAVDVQAACTGFLYALALADSGIRAGQNKTVLVVGAEILSRLLNWKDRSSCVLFGDGAGAAVLERVPGDSPHRLLESYLRADGSHLDLICIPAGGTNRPVDVQILESAENKVHLRGKEVFKEAVTLLTDSSMKALAKHGLTAADVDWFVPHQANLRIIEAVAKRLEFPMEKIFVNLDRYGNTSSATIPTALDEGVRDGRVKPGQIILMAAFGGGLTYGATVLRW